MPRPPPLKTWKFNTTSELATLTICGDDPAPPAAQALLLAADQIVLDGVCLPYPQCAHGCDIATATGGGTKRRFNAMISPAVQRARLAITRAGYGIASQTASTSGSTTSGGYAGASIITTPSSATGAESYLDTHATTPADHVEIMLTGDKIDDAPAATIDRAFKLPEGKVSVLEEFEVNLAHGVGLIVFVQTPDLEAL